MRHSPRSRAYARSHRRIWLTVSLVIVALGCGDATSPVAHHASAATRSSHETLNATELESLLAAAEDARTRLIAPLTEAPGAEALTQALVRLSGALATADAPAARLTLPALDAALVGLTTAFPAAAPDLDALRLVVLQTARALNARTAGGGP